MKWALLALVILPPATSAADGSRDPVFANIPFDRWSEKDHGGNFRWSTRITTPVLSEHQRLKIGITIQVDGSELVKRQGQGRLLLLIQLRDAAGLVYQNHSSLSLESVGPEVGRTLSVYTQDAFVVPGDYEVSTGVLISATSEHAVVRRALHVEALHHDPLPDAWRQLPPVEFLPSENPPDSWYLPSVEGRLHLPVAVKRPVRIELLVNASKTEQMPQTRLLHHARLSVSELIPAVKVLSQIKPSDGSLKIAMLDLERRRVGFEQTVARDLDWAAMKAALAEADPNTIDVKSLENSEQNPQFFLTELRRRILTTESAGPLHVLIVLSGPMAFAKADLNPIEAAADPNCKIFYIRYHSMSSGHTPLVFTGPENAPRRLGGRRTANLPNPAMQPVDELFRLIKALDPQLFDVTTPGDFRKALAAIMSEITRLSNT